MFTFTKTVESNIAYEVQHSGRRQDGMKGPEPLRFETLKDAEDWCLINNQYKTAKIIKLEFIKEYENGVLKLPKSGIVPRTREKLMKEKLNDGEIYYNENTQQWEDSKGPGAFLKSPGVNIKEYDQSKVDKEYPEDYWWKPLMKNESK